MENFREINGVTHYFLVGVRMMPIFELYSYTEEPLEISVVCCRSIAPDFLTLELCSVSKSKEAVGQDFLVPQNLGFCMAGRGQRAWEHSTTYKEEIGIFF